MKNIKSINYIVVTVFFMVYLSSCQVMPKIQEGWSFSSSKENDLKDGAYLELNGLSIKWALQQKQDESVSIEKMEKWLNGGPEPIPRKIILKGWLYSSLSNGADLWRFVGRDQDEKMTVRAGDVVGLKHKSGRSFRMKIVKQTKTFVEVNFVENIN